METDRPISVGDYVLLQGTYGKSTFRYWAIVIQVGPHTCKASVDTDDFRMQGIPYKSHKVFKPEDVIQLIRQS